MNRKNLILGGALIILIIFAYIYQGPLRDWRESRGLTKNFLSQVLLEKIERIEVKKGEDAVVLEKKETGWKIEGTKDFYVGEQVAESLDFALEKIGKEKLELIGKNKDKKETFKTDDSGVRVKITQEEKEFNFVVGKTTPDFSGSYISKADSDRTYKIGINLNVFDQDEWCDDQIFSFMPERINKMRFQYPDRQFWVEKVENKWKGILPWAFSVTEEKINEILEIMGNLQAVRIPEQSFEGTGLEKNLIIVQVVGENIDNTIMIGQSNDEGLYFAKRAGSDNIYLISKEDRDIFDRKTKDLK